MRTSYRLSLVATLVVLLIVAPSAGAQLGPPSTLRVDVGPLYLTDSGLSDVAPGNATACLTLDPATGDAPETTFAWAATPINGSYYVEAGSSISVRLAFVPDNAAAPFATSGFDAIVLLRFGTVAVASNTQHVPAVTSPATTVHELRTAADNVTVGSGDITILVQTQGNVSAPSVGPLPAAPGHNAALECGLNSLISTFEVIKGQPTGDGDLDADGLPDSEDLDWDGDRASNADEAGLVCNLPNGARNFDRDRDLAPEPADSDGDGESDVKECDGGGDPYDNLIQTPRPAGLPWGLIIFGAILLILILAIVFFFLLYGKAVSVAVVTAGELIVQPGTEGKYQLTVASLRKKGNPINFQLSATGAPEGWDAQLNPGNVVLDPVGGAKNSETVWLTVRAPTHTDPESAVVTLKAIALNAAGRKDTFKLPAKAKTITSINVPPNARVPVKRGSAVKLRGEKEEAQKEAEAGPVEPGTVWQEADRPVIDIEGVGPTHAEKLSKMGVKTVQALHGADADEVAKRLKTNPTTVRQWQAMAELIDVKGIGPQYAELLVRSAVYSIAQLAQSNPKELWSKVEATQAAREVAIQGAPLGPSNMKEWVKAAKKHPLADRPPRAPPLEEAAPEPAPAPVKGLEQMPEPTPTPPPSGAKPQLQVGGLEHAPTSFRQGDSVKSKVVVTNSGTDPQTLKLSLFVNDSLADAQTVSVKPGKSKEVKFKWVAQERNKLNIRGELAPS